MKDHPVDSGLDNYRINLNALDASFKTGVRSFVGVSSACVYPKHGQILMLKQTFGVDIQNHSMDPMPYQSEP